RRVEPARCRRVGLRRRADDADLLGRERRRREHRDRRGRRGCAARAPSLPYRPADGGDGRRRNRTVTPPAASCYDPGMRPVAMVVLVLALGGCGVYSVRLDPPPPDGARAATPLDLSVALGDVQSFANGRPEAVDPDTLSAIDVDFMRAIGASGLFREVLPRGSRADVSVDTVRELHAAPMTGGRTAYLLAVAPLAMLVPGFPHPWDYHVTRTVKLRGDVEGTSIPLPERQLA